MKHWIQILGIFCGVFLSSNIVFGQTLTQSLRGKVIDKDNKTSLIGAAVVVTSLNPTVGTSTDTDGNFRLEEIPVGRQTIEVSYLGYETTTISNLLISSGKEVVLNIELEENYVDLKEIVVSVDREQPLNEMATVSARMFSVEETQRYAASGFDPARMVQAYAGVAIGGEDLDNEIVIRGNSPRGLLWRLEGIDIPNPNHFSNPGSSGGAISMLSSSMLSNSDFYTGAFPSEYGNALAGAFDLKFRNGNNEQREFAVMLGGLGAEASMEGPFSKNSKASYLVNYRYSTLALMESLVPNLQERVPVYQDLTFKLHFPTEKSGNFSVFGLGGLNEIGRDPERDSTLWENDFDEIEQIEKQRLGILGISHFYPLSSNSYLKTVIAATGDRFFEDIGRLNPEEDYVNQPYFTALLENHGVRGHTMYHHKFNVKHILRVGAMYSNLNFKLEADTRDEDTGIVTNYFDQSGSTHLLQSYAQWKFRLEENLTLNTGFHYAYLTLNKTQSIDPRISLQWRMTPKQTLSLAVGKHSQQQHLSTYLVEERTENEQQGTPNLNLKFSKALHTVLAYDRSLGKNWGLKMEAYYQYLYDVPIASDSESTQSLLNSARVWDLFDAGEISNEGEGYNYGLDVSLKKAFSGGSYLLSTASLYSSKYRPADGKLYNTQYNGNYLFNFLYGKEWAVGKKKNQLFGINGRGTWRGGNRYTEIDFERSEQAGDDVIFEDRLFEAQYPAYFRLDLGFKYTLNKGKTTHSIMLDFQNLTNHQNILETFYDEDDNEIGTDYQTGLFPFFNYRINFK